MGKKNSWEQLKHETPRNFARFCKFRDFDGTLDAFISVHCGDVSPITIRRYSTDYKWIKRKKDYLNHHQSIIQKEQDKMVAKIARDKFQQYEKCMDLLMNRVERILADFDGLNKALPASKVVSFLNTLPSALKDMKSLQDQTASAEEALQPVVIQYVGGFDLSEYGEFPNNVVGEGDASNTE